MSLQRLRLAIPDQTFSIAPSSRGRDYRVSIKRLSWVWWGVAVSSVLMAAYALSYLMLGERVYPEQLAESFRSRPWGIYTHAAFGAVGLGLGPFQFRRDLRRANLARHRFLGRIYLVSAFMVGVSGIYMAVYSWGGASTHMGFGFMGAALLTTTAFAFARIRAANVPAHREWMMRSFSVMFSAVTFRIWLPFLLVANGSFGPAYRWSSWLAWVPNLILAEWYVRWSRSRTPRSSARRPKVVTAAG